MERTKSQSDSLVKVPLLQHHREQLSVINQRWETDLQRIREHIKGRNIAPCGPLTISHVMAATGNKYVPELSCALQAS